MAQLGVAKSAVEEVGVSLYTEEKEIYSCLKDHCLQDLVGVPSLLLELVYLIWATVRFVLLFSIKVAELESFDTKSPEEF